MTRRSRRSLSHLFAITGLGGIITLVVAVTNADDVWLAVGPLLLVVSDTLAFSPVVQSRARKAAASVQRSGTRRAPPNRRGFVTPYPQAPYAPASYSPPRISLVLPLAGVLIGLLVAFSSPILGFVSGNLPLLLLAVGLVSAVLLSIRFVQLLSATRVSYAPDDFGGIPTGLPGPWLQHELNSAGESPLSIVVIAPAESEVPIHDAIAEVTQSGVARLHYLSQTELILVTSPATLHKALSSFGIGASPLQPTASTAQVGEVTYPLDGRSPEALIAEARSRLASR